MQHFIIQTDLNQNEILIQDKELLHQMNQVLRFRVGSELILMDGEGVKAKAVITELHKKGARIEVKERHIEAAPKRRLRLVIALSKKPSTFEWIVQKATEIGVTDIIPLVSERCQVDHIRKADRLSLIIKEASEQCERPYLPKLHDVVSFETFVTSPLSGAILVGDARETDIHLSEFSPEQDQAINILIGPEGGFSEAELSSLKNSGALCFLLGENVLRMETAAIAALSVIQFG